MKIKKILISILLVILILAFLILLMRFFSARQIDDLHPSIPCDEKYLGKSEILFVIPIFENKSIADNQEWCRAVLALNKTIGMHGVYHEYKEFGKPVGKEEIDQGKREFEKCFGFPPKIFEAPQWELSRENRKMLKEQGFEIKGKFNIFLHKIYHCSDEGKFAYKTLGMAVTNKLIDRI